MVSEPIRLKTTQPNNNNNNKNVRKDRSSNSTHKEDRLVSGCRNRSARKLGEGQEDELRCAVGL